MGLEAVVDAETRVEEMAEPGEVGVENRPIETTIPPLLRGPELADKPPVEYGTGYPCWKVNIRTERVLASAAYWNDGRSQDHRSRDARSRAGGRAGWGSDRGGDRGLRDDRSDVSRRRSCWALDLTVANLGDGVGEVGVG